MKNALIISGYLRGFIENIQSIKENIIQSHDCDIYIHITQDETTDKYFNKSVSYDTILKLLNPKVLIASKNSIFSSNTIINNLLNQNYKKYWLNQEMKKIMLSENKTYDIVIQIRPDVHLKTRLNYDECLTNIQIPIDSKIDVNKLKNSSDCNICDIIAFGNPQEMDKYFDYYLHINKLIDIHNTLVNETLLYHYLHNNNIKFELKDINYFVILSLCNTIAITGDSGSGKSTISKMLQDMFHSSFVLECDRYHKWERNHENWKNYTHLNTDANYITKMCNDVFDLKIGNKVYQVDYDHTNGKFTDKQIIEPCENIIVCGLHCLYMPENTVNLKIYMDTDENLRIPWKINRDVKKRGYSIEKIYNQIKSREYDFNKYIQPQKDLADIIIRFYTNKDFVIEKFDMDEDIPCFLKIGIKSSYKIEQLNADSIINIEQAAGFNYLCFQHFDTYDNIIKNIIKSIIMNN